MKIRDKIIITIIIYQAEKSVALLIILTKISWSCYDYMGKHGSDFWTFMIYICYAETVEETEELVVGQNRKIFIIYLFFYQNPLFYNKIQKVVNYLNIPVRFFQSVAPVPESQRLFFILKQRLSNNTKATLHTCAHKPLFSPLSLNNGNKWK